MFSRYSNISIPKNYGGSRFADLSETETKTHRALTPLAPIKSSHSPSFVPIREPKEEEIADEVSDFENFEDIEAPIVEQDEELQEAVGDEDKEDEKNEHSSILKSILSNLERDELIILGLILLLISDSSQENTDVIMMLALLLVNGK